MAFAIFYNTEDLNSIAVQVQATLANAYDGSLTAQERSSIKQTFNRCWQNGLNGWASAPLAGSQDTNGGLGGDSRIIVMNSSQVTKADLISALRTLAAKVPGAQYMSAIADDLVGTCVEPWV